MKVVKKTGLVPVRFTGRGGRRGTFGVPPHVATAGVLAGELALVAPAEGIETYDVPDPAAPKQEQPAPESSGVVIPEDWEGLQYLRRVKLAKEILGHDIVLSDEEEAAGVTRTGKADDVIRHEMQRRAAAEPSAE